MVDSSNKIRRIELVKPDPEWARWFMESANEIKSILKENCIEVHHIGSTAIPNIYAKPIVDVLPVVKSLENVDPLNEKFEALGYVCQGEYGIPGRRFYWKSRTKRTHHVHLFQQGSPQVARHLAFRDFMRSHEDYAQAYSTLKRCLADVFVDDIENYIYGKSSLIQMIDYQTNTAPMSQLQASDNIIIEPYHAAWPKLATAEIKAIQSIIHPLDYLQIEHIGSTAVPGLSSKPIIDILIVIPSMDTVNQWIHPLEWLGYLFWKENPDKNHARFFKGMPLYGEKRTHHIHLVDSHNPIVKERILFRDVLRRDAKIRSAYEALKIKLAKAMTTDREAYTAAKKQFIQSVLSCQ